MRAKIIKYGHKCMKAKNKKTRLSLIEEREHYNVFDAMPEMVGQIVEIVTESNGRFLITGFKNRFYSNSKWMDKDQLLML